MALTKVKKLSAAAGDRKHERSSVQAAAQRNSHSVDWESIRYKKLSAFFPPNTLSRFCPKYFLKTHKAMSILSELTKLKLLRKVSKIPYWAIQITIGACDDCHMKSQKSVPTAAQLRSTWWGWKYPDRIAQHSCQSWGWNYPPPTKARHHQLRLSYSEFLSYLLQNLKTVLTKRKYPRVDTFSGAIIRGGLALPHWGCTSLFQTPNIWCGGL